MFVVGLTGGIGSGKSTAASILESLGTPIIDADVIARELTESPGSALDAIAENWGSEAILTSGALNRNFLRERVFTTPTELKRLEAILHPLIAAQIQDEIRHLENQPTAPSYCVVVIPLMVEKNLTGIAQRTVVIDVPVELQVERAQQRDGKSRENIEAIIKQQATREQRLAVADFVIDNSSSVARLEEQIKKLHETLVKAAIHN